jgi:hypothetical protein
MNDRELLELAAKAAGLHHCGWEEEDQAITAWFDDPRDKYEGGAWGDWNPLTSDEQAFRLAVKLGMELKVTLDRCLARVPFVTGWQDSFSSQDGAAATRRAIVRAAAEMGRAE